MAEHRPSAEQKRVVEQRARECCEYCRSQLRFAMQSFAVEHLDPDEAEGGETLDNLALSCQGCNNHKYNKTSGQDSRSGQVVSLYNPRRDRWDMHFAWSADYTLIVGLTPIGRATVETLHLNRPGLVNLRRVLFAAGEPPGRPGDGPGLMRGKSAAVAALILVCLPRPPSYTPRRVRASPGTGLGAGARRSVRAHEAASSHRDGTTGSRRAEICGSA
jgi:hypothetical protein